MASVPRILIVDDDTVITHLISTMLQKKEYNVVVTATSGEEAIGKSVELNPDLPFKKTQRIHYLPPVECSREKRKNYFISVKSAGPVAGLFPFLQR